MRPARRQPRRLVAAAAAHKVTFKLPDGEQSIEVPDDQYILDAGGLDACSQVPACRLRS